VNPFRTPPVRQVGHIEDHRRPRATALAGTGHTRFNAAGVILMADSQNKTDASEQTGVADVRLVRERIAAQYQGDIRKHIAQTDEIVGPLIEKLGLKEGIPPRRDNRRSGTAG
jgi:hypothetical protein